MNLFNPHNSPMRWLFSSPFKFHRWGDPGTEWLSHLLAVTGPGGAGIGAHPLAPESVI